MFSNREVINRLPLDIYTGAMLNAGLTYDEITEIMGLLSQTSSHFYSFFQNTLLPRMHLALLHAVIDDNRKIVKLILDAKPNLLLQEPPPNLIIESKLTWQKFYAENPLSMAVKRKQIEMIELLLPYYDNELIQTDALKEMKEKALSSWSFYLTADGKIVIPQEYESYAQSLINVFARETFPNGELSEGTESELSYLFNFILLPNSPVKLDNYLDVELFLLAIYLSYRDNLFSSFQNWAQKDAFCIRVIGLVQSVLSPETAKIFCEGLYHVVEQRREISKRASELKLLNDEPFYRSYRESHSGSGFECLCGDGGRRFPTQQAQGQAQRGFWGSGWAPLEKQCQDKDNKFKGIKLITCPTLSSNRQSKSGV